MNAKAPIFVVFLMTALHAYAVESHIFQARFYANESQPYTLSQTHFDLRNGDTIRMERLTMQLDVQVSDSNAMGYQMDWMLSDFKLSTGSSILHSLVSHSTTAHVRYWINRYGVFAEFLDWSPLNHCFDSAMVQTLLPYTNRSDSAALLEVQRVTAFVQAFAPTVLRSVHLFHQVYGLGYTLQETVDVPTTIQGLTGDTEIEGIVRKKLIAIDAETDVAVLSTATIPDSTQWTHFLQQQTIPYYQPLILGGFVADRSSGWPYYVVENRSYELNAWQSGEMLEVRHQQYIQE